MSFVPFVTPHAPSAKARDLGTELTATIDRFRRDHPGTTVTDVRQAVDLALADTHSAAPALVAALLAGVLLFGVLVFFYMGRTEGMEAQPIVLSIIIGLGILTGLIAAVARKR